MTYSKWDFVYVYQSCLQLLIYIYRSASVSMEELEISLYTSSTSDDELSGVSSVHSLGRLHFSLFHDGQNNYMIVNVHKAVALKAAQPGKVC